MAARILDGAAIALQVYAGLKARISVLRSHGVQPGLAAVLVGDNPASRTYVRNKVRACAEIGLHSEVHHLEGDIAESAVVSLLETLNRNPAIHGIIVQLPLPATLDAWRVSRAIAETKDVDGFNPRDLGALVEGKQAAFVPCTPLGVITMLNLAGISIEKKHAVVIGRSAIVGKPMSLLLINAGATVTVCNSRTPDLAAHAARADILISAVGKPGLVVEEMVKPGAVVVDIGINRLADGRLTGDVAFESVSRRAGWITPVPGGVGPMTVAMLLANTVTAAERAASSKS